MLDNALVTNTQLSHSILALRTNLAPIIKGNNKVLFTKLNNVYLTQIYIHMYISLSVEVGF